MGTRRMLSAILFVRKKEKQKILGLILNRTVTNRNPPGKCSDTLTRKESHINKKKDGIKCQSKEKLHLYFPREHQHKAHRSMR